ncbi:MAG: helix-turn-helix domain-containing protein [Tumebacillaceae bacterium]
MEKTLGQKIRDWRMKKGITQTELAEGLVTPSMISQIESDKANPSFKLLEGISRKLDVPIDEFLLDMQQELEEDTRHKLAKSLMESKEYGKAVKVLEGLLDGEKESLEEIKMELADAYLMDKQFDKATKVLERMLEEVALDKDRSKAVILLQKLGWTKFNSNDYVLAKHYFGQAIKELGKTLDFPLEARGLLFHRFALALTFLGEVTEAHDFYRRAIESFQGTSNLFMLGQGHMGLANTYYRSGDYQAAADTARTAITMFRSVNDNYKEVVAKLNYAIFQYELLNYDDSLTLLNECADEMKEQGNMSEVGNIFGEIGNVHFRLEQYQEAEKWYFRSLDLIPVKSSYRAYVYKSVAIMYEKLQNYERALEYMLSSVDMFENFGLLAETSKCYSHIVSIYQSRGELSKASDYMQKMTSSMEEGLRARGLYL